MKSNGLPAWILMLPGLLFTLAGVIMMIRDRPAAATFLAIGPMWMVIGMVMVKSRRTPPQP